MPKDYESNWDDLARQLGFEPPEEEVPAEEIQDDSVAENVESTPAEESEKISVDVAAGDSVETGESITDFFGDEQVEVGNESNLGESSAEADSEESTEGGDSWGSLAGTLGLEATQSGPTSSEADTDSSDDVLSEMFVPTMVEPAADSEVQNSSDDSDDDQQDSDATDEGDGVETIEFDVQDLTDEEDDRPRRRRKKRRRRRAVIEELREELEREKEEEAAESSEPAAQTEEREKESEAESQPSRRRRRRRDRSDSGRSRRPERSSSNRDEFSEEQVGDSDNDSDSFDGDSEKKSREKVSKNQKRRKKRERSVDSSESSAIDGQSEEPRQERKFPTWEEAIRPVVEGNMERTEKPQRRRRPKRRDN